MSFVDAHGAVSRRFDRWIRVMEIKTRLLELQDAALGEAKAMIISPPTDTGIRMIARANEGGTTYLLCWSTRIFEEAGRDARLHRLSQLRLLSADPPTIPLKDGILDVVFANCLFDFCDKAQIEEILLGIRRVLRPGGSLFAVYMGEPGGELARIWCGLFKHLQSISRGCHPVDILPFLRVHGFKDPGELCLSRFGFPIRYVRAIAPGPHYHRSGK
jgi:SAM-dependent methyltransferase